MPPVASAATAAAAVVVVTTVTAVVVTVVARDWPAFRRRPQDDTTAGNAFGTGCSLQFYTRGPLVNRPTLSLVVNAVPVALTLRARACVVSHQLALSSDTSAPRRALLLCSFVYEYYTAAFSSVLPTRSSSARFERLPINHVFVREKKIQRAPAVRPVRCDFCAVTPRHIYHSSSWTEHRT